jgi:23S rRNA (cytosine1962-C5)-methyltransferase
MTPLHLKPGKEKSLLRRHPWIFSGALSAMPKEIPAGETVEIISHKGDFLGRGAFSPQSQIAVRVWTFAQNEPVDSRFFHSRLLQAINKRAQLSELKTTTAFRLVNAESDGLPGLIVDRYHDFLVAQFLAAGVEFWKQEIIRALKALIPCTGIYERSDVAVRAKEGLKPKKGLLADKQPPKLVQIEEHGLQFLVDLIDGHKTGFYLDQRENRKQIADYAAGADVLNCFAYSGGFGIYALRGGARHLTNIENSASALELLNENLKINQLQNLPVENIQGDVFEVLRKFNTENRHFDLIILDPPKFAESRAQLTRAARGYKDINRLAFQLLRPGGTLFTFSCSGLLEPALFQKIVADAALDAGRSAQIIARPGQAADHPIALNFPEGGYLKGLICRVN